ncbi:MAG: phosphoribosylamine--glycine ligase [Sandaracinus sp.]|nr:phosphoribosylamine--glycine ligase [Sandaracinus sp.]MCB9630971.1 phosphoribosylamine--glycine ligase [Sandaracinus sp.]
MKRVLVVGSGAREHALAWRLAKDGAEVHAAPGNAGIAQIAAVHSVAADDLDAQVALAERLAVDLVVVGPEAPLVAGLVDRLAERGIAAFGPSKDAARLEGSKAFSKDFMKRHGVPTAGHRTFTDADEAIAYVREAGRPLVVKADGLAAGKGVVVAQDADEAVAAIERFGRERELGDAGATLVIEETLTGQEVSFHVVCDGTRYVALAPAQDHKRIFDGDRGPNTGGMGAYSPPPVVSAEVEAAILTRVVEPTLRGCAEEGFAFRGALFVGLMIEDGEPQVLEYNTRFGDPETECLMTRWGGSMLELLEGAAKGDLGELATEWDAPASMCVVLASEGYPGSYPKGRPIEGLDEAAKVPGVVVFHAGTKAADEGFVTAGGRVLAVTATGLTLDEAADRAYAAADRIRFEGKQLRRDIGWRARTR